MSCVPRHSAERRPARKISSGSHLDGSSGLAARIDHRSVQEGVRLLVASFSRFRISQHLRRLAPLLQSTKSLGSDASPPPKPHRGGKERENGKDGGMPFRIRWSVPGRSGDIFCAACPQQGARRANAPTSTTESHRTLSVTSQPSSYRAQSGEGASFGWRLVACSVSI